MPSDRFSRVEELFHAALELPAAERPAWLLAQCDDEMLRREVAALLGTHDSETPFELRPPPDSPQARGAGGKVRDSAAFQLPFRIGPYVVTRELGRGGMGQVYLARQEALDRQVALKLLRPSLARGVFLRRFRSEQRILARLDHPGIIGLLDAGATDDGLPYLVMEYIEGESLLAYCDARGLDIEARIKLFCRVATAVHFAHQRLVVHRDLKPTNILVTSDGEPKLLDFGIAKLLLPDESQPADGTVTALQMMTPEYASPEQLRRESVTTATDIYSLGVVLYELLTGQKPFRLDGGGKWQTERAVLEQEPERPSVAVSRSPRLENSGAGSPRPGRRDARQTRRARRLQGDLDTVVLKALEKDPARRYESAAAMRDDLQRHLAGLPLTARPESLRGRAIKFVRRNRVAVAAAALVVGSLLGGLGIALALAARARVAESRAERRSASARELANTMLFDVHDHIEFLPGATAARRTLLVHGLRYLDELSAEVGDDPGLRSELARAYLRLGDFESGYPNRVGLGNVGAATRSYLKGLALARTAYARNPADPAAAADLARLELALGLVALRRGDSVDAAPRLERAIELFTVVANERQREVVPLVDLSRARMIGGDLRWSARRVESALADYRAALALAEHAIALDAKQRPARLLAASVQQRIAQTLVSSGATGEGLAAAQAYLETSRELARSDPADADAQRNVAVARDHVAWALRQRGSSSEAVGFARPALEIFVALIARDPESGQAEQDLAYGCGELALALLADRRPAEALAYIAQGRAIYARRIEQDPQDSVVTAQLAGFDLNAARAQLEIGDSPAAIAAFESAIAGLEPIVATDPSTFAEENPGIAEAHFRLGAAWGQLAQAVSGTERQALLSAAAEAYAESRKRFESLDREGRLRDRDRRWLELARVQTQLGDRSRGSS